MILLAASVLLLSASPASAAPAAPGPTASAAPAAIPANTAYLNLSESGTTYYHEYVTENNTSTIYRLPLVFTGKFVWITVLNLTTAEGTFHSINYAQVTAANDSGTVVATEAQSGFEIRALNQYWVDYTYWTYSIYGISAPTLSYDGFSATGTFRATFGHYPGMTVGPAPINFTMNSSTIYDLKVSSNLTVSIVAPSSLSVPTGCTAFGVHCVTMVWDFEEWSNASVGTVTSGETLTLGGSGFTVKAGAYNNYTAVYYEPLNETGTNGTGGFILAQSISVFDEVFVQFWYLWVLLIVGLLAYAYGTEGRRGRRRR